MGKIEISDEERKARSERMRRLHAEGRAGAEFGKLGGRPKKKRSTEFLAEKAAEEGERLWSKLNQLLESDSEKIVLDTVKHIQDKEEQERKIQVESEVRYDQLKHEDLAELVISNFFELIRSGKIDLEQLGILEEIEEQSAIGSGETIDGSVEETG